MEKIKIVAAVLDTDRLTLYREDGETVVIRQGDARVQRIIDEATEPLTRQGWAEVSLGDADPETNDYREFEERTSGVVKFFRVAKSWLKGVFTGEGTVKGEAGFGDNNYVAPIAPIAPVSLGTVPQESVFEDPSYRSPPAAIDGEYPEKTTEPAGKAPTASDVADATPNQRPTMAEATKQIIANARPVTDPGFRTRDTDPEQDTMIAQVTDPATGASQIVPGVEHLQAQFRNASKLGSTEGVTNFLRRIAAVIGQRGHTIDELLRFMSRGDLPIADDGSIVAYKVLTTERAPKDRFVDCHSKSVPQRVGSYVTQKNVDPSRRTECSSGLHIARRGYLGGFPGNVIVLVKINPEDVIAVPTGEPNKMRSAGYHILSRIPENEHKRLRENQPIEGMEAKRLLGMALKGQHIGIIEHVIIGGPKGTQVEVVKQQAEVKREPRIDDNAPTAEAIETDLTKTQAGPMVNPKAASERSLGAKMTNEEVSKQEEAVSAVAPAVEAVSEVDEPVGTLTTNPKAPESRLQKGTRLIDVVNSNEKLPVREAAAKELMALKKTSKVGWDKLGVDAGYIEVVTQLSSNEPEKNQEKQEETVRLDPNAHLRTTAEAGKRMAEMKKSIAANIAAPQGETRGQKAQRLFKAGDLVALVAYKKAVKVGWSALGFNESEIVRINKAIEKSEN